MQVSGAALRALLSFGAFIFAVGVIALTEKLVYDGCARFAIEAVVIVGAFIVVIQLLRRSYDDRGGEE